jgi:copper chaperone CopZ
MQKEVIKVANLKCSGCANTILKNLKDMDGVTEVKVQVDQDEVEVSYLDSTTDLGKIKSRLLSMGYPEATEANGLLTQLKSFKSCMLGRLN